MLLFSELSIIWLDPTYIPNTLLNDLTFSVLKTAMVHETGMSKRHKVSQKGLQHFKAYAKARHFNAIQEKL